MHFNHPHIKDAFYLLWKFVQFHLNVFKHIPAKEQVPESAKV